MGEARMRMGRGSQARSDGSQQRLGRRLARLRCQRDHRSAQRGMVTAELAVGVLVAGMLLAVMSGVLGLAILQDRCRDVAGLVAREVARGDEVGERVARSHAPAGADIEVDTASGWIRVTVTAQRRWGRLGPVRLVGEAVAPLEATRQGP